MHRGGCDSMPRMRVDLRFLDGGGVDEIDFEIVATSVAATLSKSSTGFTVPTLPGTFGQAAWGRSPGDSTSCFTSSSYGILSGSNEDFGNDFGHPVTAGDTCDGTSTPPLPWRLPLERLWNFQVHVPGVLVWTVEDLEP